MFCFLCCGLFVIQIALPKNKVWYNTTDFIKVSQIYLTNLYIGKYTADLLLEIACVLTL